MILLFLADFGDTLIKGVSYLHMLGAMYEVRTISYVCLECRRHQAKERAIPSAFAIFAAIFELLVIFKIYLTEPCLS